MIVFVHQNNKNSLTKGTIAVDLPSKEDLHRLFTLHGNQLLLKVGITIKSKKDVFNRKIGREEAQNHMDFYPCDLKNIEQCGTKHVYNFGAKIKTSRKYGQDEYLLRFAITTVAESESVKIVWGDLL